MTMAGMMAIAASMSMWQAMVLQSGLAALLIWPAFPAFGISCLPNKGLVRLYAVRACLAVGAFICCIHSIAYLPLGVATAISFSKGLFALWLAVWTFGETLTAFKIATTALGFGGVLLVLESGGGGVSAGRGIQQGVSGTSGRVIVFHDGTEKLIFALGGTHAGHHLRYNLANDPHELSSQAALTAEHRDRLIEVLAS